MESVGSANVDISKFLELDKSKPIATNLEWKCSEILLKMLEEGVHTDMTFNAVGGSVKAHKSVLACASPVFLTMFKHGMKEQLTSNVDMSDITIDALQLFLLLLYTTNECEDASLQRMLHFTIAIDKHFIEFLKAVHKYQVESRLESVLLWALARNLSPENCWSLYDFYVMARQRDYTSRAISVCFNYIVGNYHEVIKSSCFLEAMRCNTKRVHHVMLCAESRDARRVALSKFEQRKKLRTE